jgi:hypothetical protein
VLCWVTFKPIKQNPTDPITREEPYCDLGMDYTLKGSLIQGLVPNASSMQSWGFGEVIGLWALWFHEWINPKLWVDYWEVVELWMVVPNWRKWVEGWVFEGHILALVPSCLSFFASRLSWGEHLTLSHTLTAMIQCHIRPRVMESASQPWAETSKTVSQIHHSSFKLLLWYFVTVMETGQHNPPMGNG